jgi:hypothetical protein
MARHVFPPAPASSNSGGISPLRQDPLAAMRAAAAALSPQPSGLGLALPAGSGPSTPTGAGCPAARTFTPGVVGTITYSAPEVLGVLDEPQQQPEVETVLKVGSDRCGYSCIRIYSYLNNHDTPPKRFQGSNVCLTPQPRAGHHSATVCHVSQASLLTQGADC